jgi:dipeptidyl aminopeptidase/acylaminoacyl peptidase
MKRSHALVVALSLVAALPVVAQAGPAITPMPGPVGPRPKPLPLPPPKPVLPKPGSVITPVKEPKPNAGYMGHGATTVDAATLERFRAKPLPSSITRRVQTLLDVRAPAPGVLSPDGKTLFFNWNVTGISQVWRVDGPQKFPMQMTGGEDATTVVAVMPDGKNIVVVRDQKGEENPGLYLQPVMGGPLRVIQHLPQVQTQVQHISPDGAFIYFRSNKTAPDSYRIDRYNVATSKIEAVFTTEGLWLVADRRITKTGGVLLVGKEVGSNMVEWYEYDETSKILTPLFGQGEREDYDAAYGVGDEVLVLTPKLSEFRKLYSFDRTAKTLKEVGPSLSWDIEFFSVDSAGKRLLLSINEGGSSTLRLLDAKSKRAVAMPTWPANAVQLRAGSTTWNGRFMTLAADPGNGPAQSYVVDLESKKLVAWHAPSLPELSTEGFSPSVLETYPARDGTPIPMWVRRPARCSTATSPCPVIVDFHGGPEAQARPGFSARAQLLVDAGFILVQPNVRGSDGYGRAWIHADDGVKRKKVLTDIEDAAVFIKKSWGKNGKTPKVGITGGSYGGYSTLIGMTYFAGAYDSGVEVVGISNLVTFLENTAPYRRALRISEYGDPVKDRAALLDLSATSHVDKIKAPLLLIQGATDPRVPVGEALQMYDAIQKKGVRSELIVFADEGHGVQKRDNQVMALGHTLLFFLETLGEPVP